MVSFHWKLFERAYLLYFNISHSISRIMCIKRNNNSITIDIDIRMKQKQKWRTKYALLCWPAQLRPIEAMSKTFSLVDIIHRVQTHSLTLAILRSTSCRTVVENANFLSIRTTEHQVYFVVGCSLRNVVLHCAVLCCAMHSKRSTDRVYVDGINAIEQLVLSG